MTTEQGLPVGDWRVTLFFMILNIILFFLLSMGVIQI